MLFLCRGNIQSVTCYCNPHCSYNNIYIVTDLRSICLLIYSGMDTNITRGIIKINTTFWCCVLLDHYVAPHLRVLECEVSSWSTVMLTFIHSSEVRQQFNLSPLIWLHQVRSTSSELQILVHRMLYKYLRYWCDESWVFFRTMF